LDLKRGVAPTLARAPITRLQLWNWKPPPIYEGLSSNYIEVYILANGRSKRNIPVASTLLLSA